MELVIGFVVGLIVMDVAWAYKTGVLQYAIYRVRQYFRKGA
jgi:hypothetical protein